MVNWDTTKEEMEIINKIANRYMIKCSELGISGGKKINLDMDITGTHANGNPLKLQALLDAEDVDFMHDISGIRANIDRTTGRLLNHFVPRYSV